MNTIKNAKFIKENADFGTVVPVFIKAIKPEKQSVRQHFSVLRSALMKHISTEKESVILFLHRVGQPMANAFMGMGQQKR